MLTRSPTTQEFQASILFVHGAWHGAWCWKNFLDYFSRRGFTCHAFDLPGHGQRRAEPGLAKKRLMDYVNEIDRVAKEIGNPIVIGHSFGGFMTMKYLERAQPPAAVLVAPLPFPRLPLSTLLKMTGRSPGMLPQFAAFRPTTIRSANIYRDFFLSSAPDAECRRGFANACGESTRAFLDVGTAVRLHPQVARSPVMVLAAGRDYFFPEKTERRTARVYGADFKLYPDMGHNLMVDEGWETVAGDIFDWLKARVA